MSTFLPARKKINAGIDMTPLIDVVFQLLIFLMVSSQFVKPARQVELPTGNSSQDTAQATAGRKSHMVTISAENDLILNGVELSVAEFESAMRDTLAHSGTDRLEIRGDTDSNLGTFITILETAQALGVETISYHKKVEREE